MSHFPLSFLLCLLFCRLTNSNSLIFLSKSYFKTFAFPWTLSNETTCFCTNAIQNTHSVQTKKRQSQSVGEIQLVLQNTGFTIDQLDERKCRKNLCMKIKNLLMRLPKISKRCNSNVRMKTTLAKEAGRKMKAIIRRKKS